MLKYDFTIRTRDGQIVENIHIQGNDITDAERKLRQMYHNCEVVQSKTTSTDKALNQSANIEELLSLITKHN